MDRHTRPVDNDWALCSRGTEDVITDNGFELPNGGLIVPRRIAHDKGTGTSVYVATATKGTIMGEISSDNSLYMSPRSTQFQRLCSVVLDRKLGEFLDQK